MRDQNHSLVFRQKKKKIKSYKVVSCPGFPGSEKKKVGGELLNTLSVEFVTEVFLPDFKLLSLTVQRCCRVWMEHRAKLCVPALHLTGHILCRGFRGPGQLHKNKNNTPDPPWKAAANSHLTQTTTTTRTPQRKTPTFHSDFASLKWIYKVFA